MRWLSPESITRRIFNVQTDVYAYGITLGEILTQGMFISLIDRVWSSSSRENQRQDSRSNLVSVTMPHHTYRAIVPLFFYGMRKRGPAPNVPGLPLPTAGAEPFRGTSDAELLRFVAASTALPPPTLPAGSDPRISDLIGTCMLVDPTERPDFGSIVHTLAVRHGPCTGPCMHCGVYRSK